MDNEQEIKFYTVAEVSKMLGISRSRTEVVDQKWTKGMGYKLEC